MKAYPKLSVIIVTKNNQRTLPRLLSDIKKQSYSNDKLEIIIVDGNSTDETKNIIKNSGLKIKFVTGKIPNDPEACKGEGLSLAKGEIVGLIDSDNYFPNSNWFKKMIDPLIDNPNLVGSYTWRFAYSKKENALNRYFSLIGSADPVGLYLGKADKMSYISDKWIGFGKVIENNKDYYILQFDKDHFPTLGSNGFFARRKILLKGKADIKHFFHIDTPYDLVTLGFTKYAAVKDVVIHDTAITFFPYFVKRAKYMQLHYQKRAGDRRYRVFDPSRNADLFRIFLFVFLSLTLIQPLYVSIKGYMRIRDKAWFLHPPVCFGMVITYGVVMLSKLLK